MDKQETKNQEEGVGERSGITIELLEDAVKASSRTQNVKILNFTTSAGSKKGDNYASVVIAVEVKAQIENNDEVKTFYFIVKEIPPDPTWKELMKEVNLFEKEIQVYTTIFPAMEEVQRHFGVMRPIQVEVPEFYSSLKHPEFLVFENLVKKGFKMADRRIGLDYNHCRLVMIELGKFHSLSYALKCRSDKPLLVQFPFLEEISFGPKMEHVFRPILNNSYDTAIEAMEDIDKSLASKMRRFAGNAYQTCKDIIDNPEGIGFIGHGDFGVNNFLFKYEKSDDGMDIPVAIKLLDFQVVRMSSPAVDISQFIYNSTTSDLRRDHLKDLLKLYHDTFTKTLQSMGLECTEFTFQRLLDKFRTDSLFGFFFGCLALPVFMVPPEDTFEMGGMDNEAVGEEFASRVNDNMVLIKDNRDFRDRLKGIVKDLEETGLI